jgi:hypothetical protein
MSPTQISISPISGPFLTNAAQRDARGSGRRLTDPADKAFEQGRAMAYYEVISLMRSNKPRRSGPMLHGFRLRT